MARNRHETAQPVVLAIDRVADGAAALSRSARLGVLTNRSARTADGLWTGDVLLDGGYRVALFLTPEHGLAVDAPAGAAVAHARVDAIPVLSMYGADAGPVEEAMSTVDAVVVDLPDVGCRYYTYAWTVREVLKRAARHNRPVMVLDRPNPLGGLAIEGNIPDPQYDSPVCASYVPVRHGLTMGELALWNRRHFNLDVDVSVITMAGWRRDALWPAIGLPWTPPSPAIHDAGAALLYPGTCLLEGTNVSEGRGTTAPFTMACAPFLDGVSLARALAHDDALAGARIEPVTLMPTAGKWTGQRCEGVRLLLEDPEAFRPVRAGLALIAALASYPSFAFLPGHFDALAGTSVWRTLLAGGESIAAVAGGWPGDESRFRSERDALLLY